MIKFRKINSRWVCEYYINDKYPQVTTEKHRTQKEALKQLKRLIKII